MVCLGRLYIVSVFSVCRSFPVQVGQGRAMNGNFLPSITSDEFDITPDFRCIRIEGEGDNR